jgi:hypothetical protein
MVGVVMEPKVGQLWEFTNIHGEKSVWVITDLPINTMWCTIKCVAGGELGYRDSCWPVVYFLHTSKWVYLGDENQQTDNPVDGWWE